MKKLIAGMLAVMMLVGVAYAVVEGKKPDTKTLDILKRNGIECAQLLDSKNVDNGWTVDEDGYRFVEIDVPSKVYVDKNGTLKDLILRVEGRNKKEGISVWLNKKTGVTKKFGIYAIGKDGA